MVVRGDQIRRGVVAASGTFSASSLYFLPTFVSLIPLFLQSSLLLCRVFASKRTTSLTVRESECVRVVLKLCQRRVAID